VKRAPRRTAKQEAAALFHRAEAARTAGRTAEAVRLYLQVADRYPRLFDGEASLYTAADLSSGSRRRALLERYLKTYPTGMFAAEARKQVPR
jgi:hypothetical protein